MNLANLFLRRVTVHAKVFDIITPQVTKLTLIDCRNSQIVNVIAPQLENLTVIDSYINYMKAPLRLSYLCYSSFHHYPPQWFKDCFQSLNEVTVSLYLYRKDEPYKEKAARETINMLQELHSARCLTLNMDIVEPPPTKEIKAKEAREKKRARLLAYIESGMKVLQALVEKENMLFVERKQALESRKAAFENLFAKLKLLTKSKMIQSEPERYQTKDVTAGLRTQILACLRELKSLVDQGNGGSIAIFRKKECIKLYLEDLHKLQRAKHQLEEAETLFVTLDSTC
ncbi:hypothetical protein Tco_0959197 [Tanacetum coccineum]